MSFRTQTTTFHKVGFTAEKSGICPACGKRAGRKLEFYQTMNPWNKNADGLPKTGAEIMEALRPEAAKWKAEPCYHAKCEP